MGLGDFLSNLFMKDEQKSLRNHEQLEQKVLRSEKTSLSPSDVYSLTYFPYDFSAEFAVPLSTKQKDYIVSEIQKWYKIFFEINTSNILKKICSNIENDELDKYHNLKPEEFELMISTLLYKHIGDVVLKIISSYSDEILIVWKPIQKGNCFFPDDMEYNIFISELSKLIKEDIYDVIIEQKEDMQELIEIQTSYDSYEQKIKRLTFLIKAYLSYFQKDIMDYCFDRLMTEYYSYPEYIKNKTKFFDNKIFSEFHDTFKCSNFIELFSTVKEHMDTFFIRNNKEQLRKWANTHQEELFDFIIDYYKNISEDELAHLSYRDLSKYAFSMDCFTVILFKINLDGISKE